MGPTVRLLVRRVYLHMILFIYRAGSQQAIDRAAICLVLRTEGGPTQSF